MSNVLTIDNLRTHFFTDAGVARAVDGVSFKVPAGKCMALVGESGCGKSVTALSILRLIPEPPGRIVDGSIHFDGRDLTSLSQKAMRSVRGNGISMIFQEPMTSLNPVFRVGRQVAAAIRVHRDVSKTDARKQTIDLFKQVGIPSPETRIDDYPHQMSGGMRQRVMIAMALACDPKLLIADEPTTALDVTIQAQILDLLRRLQEERGMAVLLITHDLGVVAENAHEVAIMYAGKVVERAAAGPLFEKPQHPYTQGLFASLPQVASAGGSQGKELHTIKGLVPPATQFPEGCRFHPRCPYAMDVCRRTEPPLDAIRQAHQAACWLHDPDMAAKQGKAPGLPEVYGGQAK